MAAKISEEEAKMMAAKRVLALKEAEEALGTGASTLEQMQGQGEQVDHARATAALNEYNLQKSRRMVRGMTWSGWAANLVSNEPAPPTLPPRRAADVRRHHGRVEARAQPEQGAAADEWWGSESTSVKAQLRAQDDYLEQQLANAQILAGMAQTLGESAASQNTQLGTLEDQVEHMGDETRAIIRMQGRLASSVRGKPVFDCFCAIEHVPSGQFLGVSEGGDVTLAPLAAGIPFGGRWEAYRRQDGVFGFKSLASRAWLGQTMLGYIKARGAKMGTWECWEIDLHSEKPILCCSANSSSGGWIHVSIDGRDTLVAKTWSPEDKRAAPKWKFHILGQKKSST